MPCTPGLYLIESPQLDQATSAIIQDLRALAPGPFEAPVIMVPHRAFRDYLEFAIARELGLAASLELRSPARLLDLLHGSERMPEWEPRGLRWRIAAQLHSLREHLPLSLRSAVRPDNPSLTLNLARQLASRFYQLQLHRPELIRAWEAGLQPLDHPDADWQQTLWLRLVQTTRLPSLVSRQDQQLAALSQRTEASEAWPRSLLILSETTLPPLLLEALHQASNLLPVRWYLLNLPPHPYPLPTKAEYSCLRVLKKLDHIHREELPSPATAAAPTLSFHRCHSPQREIETLYELISSHLARDPSLRPEDITLYLSELTAYLPAVDAVFGSGDPKRPGIPNYVADRPWAARTRLAAAATALLSALPGRFGRDEILGLLSYPAIRQASQINTSELGELHRLVTEAQIRWGVDAADRVRNYHLPAVDRGTWRAGLASLQEQVASSLTGIPQLEEDPGTSLLRRTSAWLERLARLHDEILGEHTPGEWQQLLGPGLNGLLRSRSSGDGDTLRGLLQGITTLLNDLTRFTPDQPISWQVLHPLLLEVLDEGGGGAQLRGGVRICQLNPGAILPCRIALFAGFDDDHFPPQPETVSWDLLAAVASDGTSPHSNADPREEYLALFAEAVSSATDAAHLAWTGRSTLDNSHRSASIVIDRLLQHQALVQGVEDAETLVHEEPLQPFSTQLFSGSAPAPAATASASPLWLRVAQGLRQAASVGEDTTPLSAPISRAPTQREPPREVELRELEELVIDPPTYFWTRVLRLPRLPRLQQEREDNEPILPGDHQQRELNRFWLEHSDSTMKEVLGSLDASTLELAPGGLGRAAAARSGMLSAIARSNMATGDDRETRVSLKISGYTINGFLPPRTPTGMQFIFPQSIGHHTRHAAWVRHLLFNATGLEDEEAGITSLIGTGKEAKKIFAHFTAIPQENAAGLLEDLLRLREEMQHQALPLFPRSGWAWASTQASAKGDATLRAMETWSSSFQDSAGERGDPCIQRIFGNPELDPHGSPELWESFVSLAERIYLPMARSFQNKASP